MRDKNSRTEFLMKSLSTNQKIKNLIVTKGKEGAIMYNKGKNKFNSCGAFAGDVVDKIGAGDAMLSIISLCLKNKLTEELSLLLGSLGAAQSAESIGNKDSVGKNKVIKTLDHLLK